MGTQSERQRAYRKRQREKLAEAERILAGAAPAPPPPAASPVAVRGDAGQVQWALGRIEEWHHLDTTPHGEEMRKMVGLIRKGLGL